MLSPASFGIISVDCLTATPDRIRFPGVWRTDAPSSTIRIGATISLMRAPSSSRAANEWKPGAGNEAVFVDHPQIAETRMLRIVVITERTRVPAVEPAFPRF